MFLIADGQIGGVERQNSSLHSNDLSFSGASNALQLIRSVAHAPQRHLSNLSTSNVAYCPQVPSMHAGSIRSNILMGSEMDQARYRDVLQGCCLLKDIEVRFTISITFYIKLMSF